MRRPGEAIDDAQVLLERRHVPTMAAANRRGRTTAETFSSRHLREKRSLSESPRMRASRPSSTLLRLPIHFRVSIDTFAS